MRLKLTLALLLLCNSVFAQNVTNLIAGQRVWAGMQITTVPSSGGGTCSTPQDGYFASFTPDNEGILGYDSSRQYFAVSFIASNSYTACAVQWILKAYGSPSGYGVKVGIYTDSSGAPGTLIGSLSPELDVSTLTSSLTTNVFDGLSASLTVGTKYWKVMEKSSGSFNYGNGVWLPYGGAGVNVILYSSDFVSWSTEANNTQATTMTFSN
jgi:hypothetical protein